MIAGARRTGPLPNFDRRRRVAALRAMGWSYSLIGKNLGISKQGAMCLHKRYLQSQGMLVAKGARY